MTIEYTEEPRMGQPVEIRLENVRILSYDRQQQNVPPYSFSILA